MRAAPVSMAAARRVARRRTHTTIDKGGTAHKPSAVLCSDMRAAAHGGYRLPFLALALLLVSAPALAQSASTRAPLAMGPDPNQGVRIPASQAEGLTIDRVYVHLVNPTGDPSRDRQTAAEVAAAFRVSAGGTFVGTIVAQAVREVRQLPIVDAVEERTYQPDGAGSVTVALLVRVQPAAAKPAPAASGFFVTGRLSDIGTLYESSRGQLKLLLNPAFGVFWDRNAWLGNPTDFRPTYDVPSSIRWPEFGLEAGAAGIHQLGRRPVYAYGAASYLASGTLSPDVFSSTDRTTHGEVEQLYGGLLVARKGAPLAFDLSAGRQRFNLNRNFLFGFVLGSGNGADRGAAYLAPRKAQDLVVNARLRYGASTFQAFLADPNELDVADTRTRLAGVNVKFNDNRRIDASLTVATAVRGTTTYTLPDGGTRTRDGLRTVNPRARWNSAFGLAGLWLEGEFAHQWHSEFDMSARGAGAWIGYRASTLPWKPAVLYRYSWFSGDDPATPTYERFDPLLGGVQRDWLQGLVMIKMMNNANLVAHRIEVSVRPRPGMDISVDIYSYRAQQANNRGASARPFQSFTDLDLGYEIAPTLQWSITPNVYVQALVSSKVPGAGMAGQLSRPAKTWTTCQFAVYAGL